MDKEIRQDDGREKELVFFVIAPGCGNHMITDLLRKTPLKRVSDELEWFCRALLLARRDPSTPVVDKLHDGARAIDAINDFFARHGVATGDSPLDDASAAEWIARYIGKEAGDRAYFVHGQGFAHFLRWTLPDGTVAEWTTADRDEARALLFHLLRLAGYSVRCVGFVRNPINIFLSRRERFSDTESESDIRRSIDEFLTLVARLRREEGLTVIRYEDVCRGALDDFLAAVGLSESEKAAFDRSIPHRGEVAKWFTIPRTLYRELSEGFSAHLTEFDYGFVRIGPVVWAWGRLLYNVRKWMTEIQIINAIFRGDFSRGEAMVRHRLSLVARVVFRSSYLVPAHRRNYEAWCAHRGVKSLVRPLWKVLAQRVGLRITGTR